METKLIGFAIDAVLALVVVGLLAWFGRGALGFLQAPAERDAAIGANAALVEGGKAQNAGVERLQAASKERKAASEAAVKAAGTEESAKAAAIAAKPTAGDTPLARAANRINAEFTR